MHHAMPLLIFILFLTLSCQGNPVSSPSSSSSSAENQNESTQAIQPPFAVQGNLEGLLLVWFDEDGLHSAKNREEIPENHRKIVRVDSLAIAPEKKLDPDWVYITDITQPKTGTSYSVQKMKRAAFEKLIDKSTGYEAPKPQKAPEQQNQNMAQANVILYGASWCGACRSTAAFFRKNNVTFVEKDVEKDPNAQKELQKKMHQAGLVPSGIPVIDFQGTMVQGFNQPQLQKLIEQYTKTTI